MDKFMVKQKRKSPEPSVTRDAEKKTKYGGEDEKKKPSDEERMKKKTSVKAGTSSEVSIKKRESIDYWLGKSVVKDKKKEEKNTEIPKEKKPGTSRPKESEKKKENQKPKASEETKKKNQLKTADQLPEGVNKLGALLPGIRGKVISDEDLDKLVLALCGDTGKTYDSDDSILSDIDRMDDKEIAERDRKFRQTIEYLDELPNKMEALNAVLNQGNETKKEREERRRVLRELQSGLKTKEERDRAEKKRVKKVERMERRLKTNVQVFEMDMQKKTQLKVTLPMISCSQLSGYLEILADFVPNEKKSDGENEAVDFRAQIKEIDEEAFERKIKFCSIRGKFYTEEKTIIKYLKKKIRKMLIDPEIFDVLDGDRYGFEFSTRDVLLVLENYYSMNKPATKDNGSSIKPLGINIAKLIKSAFHVARAENPRFELNEDLKMAMFD